MTHAVCHVVTPPVTTGVRRDGVTHAQNQNQNQTVVDVVGGSSVAEQTIHRYCSSRGAHDAWMGRFAAAIGGES